MGPAHTPPPRATGGAEPHRLLASKGAAEAPAERCVLVTRAPPSGTPRPAAAVARGGPSPLTRAPGHRDRHCHPPRSPGAAVGHPQARRRKSPSPQKPQAGKVLTEGGRKG